MAFIQGSSIDKIWVGSGMSIGFCNSWIDPSLLFILYMTPGVVVMSVISNSLSSLWVIISKWSKPKNPHRNPKPNALEVSGS